MTPVLAAVVTGLAGLVAGVVGVYVKDRVDHRREAAALVRRYRDPLLHAAYELQSRVWNIVDRGFLTAYGGPGGYGELSTLWVFGQYFGWAERLRRDVQFLDLGTQRANRELAKRLAAIRFALASDTQVDDPRFMVFRAEQRAIGEVMIGADGTVLGFAAFSRAYGGDPVFAGWFAKLAHDLEAVRHEERPEHYRLRLLQGRLMDLVDLLDPQRVRFGSERDRLPLPPGRSELMPPDAVA